MPRWARGPVFGGFSIILIASCAGSPAPATSATPPPATSTSTAPIDSTSTAPTTSTVPTTTASPITTTTVPQTTVPDSSTTGAPTTSPPDSTTAPPAAASQLVWQGPADRHAVALTFDAGSDRGYAEQILDLLRAGEIRATFGMTGRWAESNPDLLRRMVEEGHTLMNHTYDHPHMETLSTRQRLMQLRRTESIVAGATGATMLPYFRPPYGAYNQRVLVDVGSAGYRYSVMWTVDSLGWQGLPAGEVVDRCLAGAEPGAIFLLHVGAASTDSEALPGIVSGLQGAGYEFVTITELIP